LLGRSHARDRSTGAPDQPGYDPLGVDGAGVLYERGVKLKYLEAPQNLHASNRPSDTNIANIPVRIVVAQLAPQTIARGYSKTLSRRIVLRPGNQSLVGT
jgi:hypothetical protein